VDRAIVTAVEAIVERICDKGCRRVWDDISALERSEPIPEVRGLSAAERSAVLMELKDIMAVYARGTCTLD
jgi:hypothetical protein